MTFQKNGFTLADAQNADDKPALAALKRAEKATGFRTGIRGSDEGLQMVTCRFYPEVIFWIAPVDTSGTLLAEPRRMQADDYSRTWSLLDGPPASAPANDETPQP